MASVLLVHGMRMQGGSSEKDVRSDWPKAIRACLAASAWGRNNPGRAAAVSVDVAYWGDLFRRPKKPAPNLIWKGPVVERLQDLYYATLRRTVQVAAKMSFFDAEGRPRGPFTPFVDRMVQQSAVYMNNGPVMNPTPGVPNGAFHQVQHRILEKLLNKESPPCVVVGHSLGSVIAYEGLCTNVHGVRSLVTIGSPLATPHLILEPLRERLWRLSGSEKQLPWPGVHRWDNFYAAADVWCVPVKRLAPLFPKRPFRDHQVRHGSASPSEKAAHGTHLLQAYLSHHPKIGDAIGAGLDLCAQELPPLPRRT